MLWEKAESNAPIVLSEWPTSAYIHIPFCRRRCYYCDFAVSVVGDRPPVRQVGEQPQPLTGSNSGTIAHYVDMLCEELRRTPTGGQPLTTVFFGGGTPSLLSVAQLDRILTAIDQRFGIASQAEISMEIDPGTFDLAQLQGYKAAGVNRVSLGVQAFQSDLLALCGRSHTVADVYTAVEWVQQAGFENFSLDLMSGLPQQTLDHWQESLTCAIALHPTHLSCYDLTIEPMTAFGRQYTPGDAPLPAEDTTAHMYRLAQKALTSAGYDHYEISNYAKPGYQCRHNRVYWENRPFYGFGMGATSSIGSDRSARPRKTREYYAWVEQLQPTAVSLTAAATPDRLLDTLMLGLRLAEGLSLAALIAEFGQAQIESVWHCLHPYWDNGWIAIEGTATAFIDQGSMPTTGRLRLTDPEGFLFSNVILTSLFAALDT